jgi:hypothetical protein
MTNTCSTVQSSNGSTDCVDQLYVDAALNGDVKKIKKIIEDKKFPEHPGIWDLAYLNAAKNNHLEIIKCLIENHSFAELPSNVRGIAVQVAVEQKDFKAFSKILPQGCAAIVDLAYLAQIFRFAEENGYKDPKIQSLGSPVETPPSSNVKADQGLSPGLSCPKTETDMISIKAKDGVIQKKHVESRGRFYNLLIVLVGFLQFIFCYAFPKVGD